MCLPVACGDVCILDGVAAVEHFIVAHIDAHMRSPCRIIGALEEDQITGLGIGCGTLVQMLRNPSAPSRPKFQPAPQLLYTHDTKPEQSKEVDGLLPLQT